MTQLMLLNALLILAGPFLVVAPLAVAGLLQMSPPHPRPARRTLLVRPARMAVAW